MHLEVLAGGRRLGVDALWAMYQWLDLAPQRRSETGGWFHRRDEYEQD